MKLISPLENLRPWRSWIGDTLLLLFIIISNWSYAHLYYAGVRNPPKDRRYPFCAPNGNVSFYEWDLYQGGDLNGGMLFTVTNGFGGLTFAQAKAIDIVFDLVIGRGSQLFFTWAFYSVIRRTINHTLETTGMSFRLMFSLCFNRISLHSLLTLLKSGVAIDKNRSRNTERKGSHYTGLRLTGVFIIILYIVTLPTFLSAVTSYQPETSPFVEIPDTGLFMPTSNLTIADLVIADGDRIGLAKNAPIDMHWDIFQALSDYYVQYHKYVVPVWSELTCANISEVQDEAYIKSDNYPPYSTFTLKEHSAAIKKCNDTDGLAATSDFDPNDFTTSTIDINHHVWNLTAPPLNITPRFELYDNRGSDYHVSDDLSIEALVAVDNLFYWNNISFSAGYILEHSFCQATDKYKWGYSRLMLTLVAVYSTIVALVVWILHRWTYYKSRADRYKLDFGSYRDAIDLVDEMRLHCGEEVNDLSAKKLKKHVHSVKARVYLETQSLLYNRQHKSPQVLYEDYEMGMSSSLVKQDAKVYEAEKTSYDGGALSIHTDNTSPSIHSRKSIGSIGVSPLSPYDSINDSTTISPASHHGRYARIPSLSHDVEVDNEEADIAADRRRSSLGVDRAMSPFARSMDDPSHQRRMARRSINPLLRDGDE